MVDVDADRELLQAFEPVLQLTEGELFLPVGVDAYVRQCRLWLRRPDDTLELLAPTGELTLERLAALGTSYDGSPLTLSGLPDQASRVQRVRLWFRAVRPHFRAAHRLARVGLLGRLVDAASRASLLFRGAVPGGSAASALAVQQEHLEPGTPRYHGRVLRDGDWLVLQYWFFFCFNNWRSGFSGVNEHEGDWEQVTIYLDHATLEDGLPVPRWVVFSSHDEVGDDLRRRWDDPDLTVVDGRHPVVFAGAGSHSGAFLPGEYLVTVVPPRWKGVVGVLRALATLLTPWTRAAHGESLGIPYVDYARGDGAVIGPGGDLGWTPVVVDDETPWVRDFRGLWGHDTRDRLGGERGPAGPRYERDGTVRPSWGDPVGWAGLAKVAANRDLERAAVLAHAERLDQEIRRLRDDGVSGRERLMAAASGLAPNAPARQDLTAQERSLHEARMRRASLLDERRTVRRRLDGETPPAQPHDHLRHRRLPLSREERARERLLLTWSVVSTPLLLGLVAYLLLPTTPYRPVVAVLALAAILSVEAFARGYLGSFLRRLGLVLLLVVAGDLVVQQLLWASVALLGVAAAVVLLVNLRDTWRR